MYRPSGHFLSASQIGSPVITPAAQVFLPRLPKKIIFGIRKSSELFSRLDRLRGNESGGEGPSEAIVSPWSKWLALRVRAGAGCASGLADSLSG
jgi:hypothetical protein